MYNYYTAVGRLQMNGSLGRKKYPMVIVNNREYILDLQEMMLWSVLNWRILDADEIILLYQSKENEVGYQTERSCKDCLHRLVQRGLVSQGTGDTEENALYDLISELYVIPISESIWLRLWSFLKLTVMNGVPYSVTRKLLKSDKRSDREKQVMHLASQALMSTAEIIKCVECGFTKFKSEDHLVDALYHDDVTTCDNLPSMTRRFAACRPVMLSVANLYLRRQIIFERV